MKEQFEAALQMIDAETTRLGDLVQSLVAQLGNRTDLTADQESTILTSLNAIGDKLKQIGNNVSNPVPNPTPDPNDGGGNIPV